MLTRLNCFYIVLIKQDFVKKGVAFFVVGYLESKAIYFMISKAIGDFVKYIENNLVWAGLVPTAAEWQCSSSYARNNENGVVPDTFAIPVRMLNSQDQRIGVV